MPKYLIRYFYLLSLFFLIASCNSKGGNNTVQDYKFFNTNQQNGWKSKRINQFVGDINYTATEVPIHYYLLKNLGDNKPKIDSVYKVNARERVLEIEFQHTEQTDLLLEEYTHRSYEEAVKYMAFSIEKDFTIVTSSNDTIKCAGAQFERNFKVAPFKRALLYFSNINPDDTIKLIYQDNLFGNGIIKFSFNEIPLKL